MQETPPAVCPESMEDSQSTAIPHREDEGITYDILDLILLKIRVQLLIVLALLTVFVSFLLGTYLAFENCQIVKRVHFNLSSRENH